MVQTSKDTTSFSKIMKQGNYVRSKKPSSIKDWDYEYIMLRFRNDPSTFLCRAMGRRQPQCDKCNGKDLDCEYKMSDHTKPVILVINLEFLNDKQLTYLRDSLI